MNPLFASYQKKNNQKNQDNNIVSAIYNFGSQLSSQGLNPEAIVRQKIQNKEMTQAQFEQLGQAANAIMAQFFNKR